MTTYRERRKKNEISLLETITVLGVSTIISIAGFLVGLNYRSDKDIQVNIEMQCPRNIYYAKNEVFSRNDLIKRTGNY